jgi:hypothetical protein
MTMMIDEECQTQTGSSARPHPEQTPSEMVSQPEARMKSRQVPMISFTIKQSLEEQRTFINSNAAQAKKLRETANAQKKNQEEPRRSSKTKKHPEDPTEAQEGDGHRQVL